MGRINMQGLDTCGGRRIPVEKEEGGDSEGGRRPRLWVAGVEATKGVEGEI